MRQIYCISHQKFEVVTYESGHVTSFNEQAKPDHHFADEMEDYIHAGPRKECRICLES